MTKKRYHDSLWKPVGKAITDYKMLQDGDRVAIGISGGKDSLTLLTVLAEFRRIAPVKFELVGCTVDMGYPAPLEQIRDLCRSMGVSWSCVHTKIFPIIFDYRKEDNPCSLCSKLRNGALHAAARQMGCNKVALAHNLDDAIETFFLCLFYERRIKTFQPVSYLSRRKLTLIRPLIYVREKTIISYSETFSLPVVENPCPANHHTQREEMKKLVNDLEQRFPGVRDRMLTAFNNIKPDYLWRK